MSNQSFNANEIENDSLESTKNDNITSEEVLKDDTNKSEEDKSDKKDKPNKEDMYSVAIGNIYQWACKLKDEFKFEATDRTHEVSEKAAAIMLNKLLDGIDAELETFDKKVEDSKKLIANAEAERNKITDKKDKYRDMIAKLES